MLGEVAAWMIVGVCVLNAYGLFLSACYRGPVHIRATKALVIIALWPAVLGAMLMTTLATGGWWK